MIRRISLRRGSQQGQGLVEFSLVLPLFMMLFLIMLEFGFAFNHNLTLGLATREGARVGAALGSGETPDCIGANAGDPKGVDPLIVAGVQRILKSPGSDVVMANVTQIRIFKANSTGAQISGFVNVWTYTGAGSGIDVDPGQTADKLDFTQSTVAWPACSRLNGGTPDSVGVGIRYSYALKTPLSSFMGFMRGSQSTTFAMNDQTVMVLQPDS